MFYHIEVAMKNDYKLTPEKLAMIGLELGFGENNVKEQDNYSVSAEFKSDTNADVLSNVSKQMFQRSWSRDIRYVDIFYSGNNEINPHRITIWDGGRVQDYRTHVLYEEVE